MIRIAAWGDVPGLRHGFLDGRECAGATDWAPVLAAAGVPGEIVTARQMHGTTVATALPGMERPEADALVVATPGLMAGVVTADCVPVLLVARAERVAAAVQDPGEFLWSIRREPRFSRDFRSTPGDRVAYHAPCHLRAQAVGFKGRDLLRLIPGVAPQTVMECCGHDGTYAMKVESFEASRRIGQKAFDGMAQADAPVWVTECPLAALQFQQHAGVKAMHPMSVLARAYRPDGFPTPLAPAEKTE